LQKKNSQRTSSFINLILEYKVIYAAHYKAAVLLIEVLAKS
jgi:hypothetical protein